MFRNYFITAFRNIFRQKGYSLINVTGLAIGIVSCLFIVLYILDEYSYDRFHEKGERIYRLFFDYTSPNGETFSHAVGPYRLADELQDRYPEIKEAVRISFPSPSTVKFGEIEFLEDNIMLADPNIFDVFTFDILRGDPATALTEPFTCVISSEMAEKFFGTNDPLGRTLTLPNPGGEAEMMISGVFQS
ncbi:MAG: ABC transporter permease, partial [Bacteroidales bacterium]|nr:ABC transporter permease [Bacteroidales bacterium]